MFSIPRTKKTSTSNSKDREIIQFKKIAEGIYSLGYKSKQIQSKYTKEQVQTYLDNVDEIKLRDVSNYFFNISGEYKRLVNYFANILTFDYLISPKIKTSDQLDQKKFITAFTNVMDYSDQSYIKEVSKFISLIVVKDGTFYGIERELNGIVAVQQLPPNFCRSLYKIDGNYTLEFNLKFFDTFTSTEDKIKAFDLFPQEFLKMYLQYKENPSNKKEAEWILVSPEIARVHKLTDDGVSFLSPIFPELIGLKEYKQLDKDKSKMDLYKLLVHKLPFDKDKGFLIKLEEAQQLHSNVTKMVTQEGIDVISTPCDLEAINLQERGNTVKDNIEKGINTVYGSAGVSKILFNSNSEGGSIGLDKSSATDVALMLPLLDQFKIWYENKINNYLIPSRNYSFEVTFLPISIFNRNEMVEMYKGLATLGYSKLAPVVASGIKQTTFINMIKMEKDIYNLDELMIPLSTSYTQSGESGRPQKSEGKLTEKGLEAKDKETNKTRAKK